MGKRPFKNSTFLHPKNFERPKNREDSSDFDDFWTKLIASTRSKISKISAPCSSTSSSSRRRSSSIVVVVVGVGGMAEPLNPPHPLRMAGVWNFSVLQLYSLESSFAIGLRHSTVLIPPRHFGLQNRSLGLKNRYVKAQNRFPGPPKSFFRCSWPLSSQFYRFGVDFGWILVAPGLEIELFSW